MSAENEATTSPGAMPTCGRRARHAPTDVGVTQSRSPTSSGTRKSADAIDCAGIADNGECVESGAKRNSVPYEPDLCMMRSSRTVSTSRRFSTHVRAWQSPLPGAYITEF